MKQWQRDLLHVLEEEAHQKEINSVKSTDREYWKGMRHGMYIAQRQGAES